MSGRLLESPRLKADATSLRSNEDVFKKFVKRLGKIGQRIQQDGTQYFWKGVHKDEVENLLREFKTHPWHLSFQGGAIADFIQDSDVLTEWDVVIAEGSISNEYALICGDETLLIKPENRTINATRDQISISGTKVRVGAGGATKLGLTKAQREIAEKKFKKNHADKAHFPDSAYLDVQRPPILMLHIISVDRTSTDRDNKVRTQIDEGCDVPDFLFALGVGIPAIGDGKEKTANYVVNLVEFRNYYDTEENEDE